MSDPIVRMYASEDAARAAVRKLTDDGYDADRIFLITPAAGSSADAIANAIMAGFVLRSHARVYAQGIQQGRSLVVVRAYFGTAGAVTAALDACGPVDTGLAAPKEPSIAWDEAAPLSSALHFPPLSRHCPAPLSAILGIPALAHGRTWLSTLFGELGNPHFSLFGTPALTRNPAPLSSALNLKTVSESKGPWEKSFGLPLLSASQGGWTSSFGLPLLTRGG